MRKSFLLFFVFFGHYLFAQDYVVEEKFDPDNYANDSTSFENFSLIARWGNFVTNNAHGELIEPIGSNYVEFKYQYYFEFFKGCKLAIGSGYSLEAFKLKNDSSTLFLDSLFHLKRKFRFHNISTNFGINFYSNKEQSISSFLQFGVYYDLGFRSSYITWDEVNEMKLRSRATKLPFINPYNYGFEVRLGYGRIAGFLRYRLTDKIKDGFGYRLIPIFNFGIELEAPLE